MQLTILGAGNVGTALGLGWSRVGHKITYGVPTPGSPKHAPVAAAAGGATVTTVANAVTGADAIILATPWDAVPAALNACGNLSGRVLLDVTNPLRFGDAGLELTIGFSSSGGEQVAAIAPGGLVVKTMNQVGAGVMAEAHRYVSAPVMFAAGDDPTAKNLALTLVRELGFDARDAGPLRMSRLLEPMAILWIDQVMRHAAPATNAFAFLSVQ